MGVVIIKVGTITYCFWTSENGSEYYVKTNSLWNFSARWWNLLGYVVGCYNIGKNGCYSVKVHVYAGINQSLIYHTYLYWVSNKSTATTQQLCHIYNESPEKNGDHPGYICACQARTSLITIKCCPSERFHSNHMITLILLWSSQCWWYGVIIASVD